MKTTLTFILALLFVGTVNGQSLYLSSDAGIQNTQIGVNYDLGNEYKVRLMTGYTQSHTKGDYMSMGIGAEKTIPVNIGSFQTIVSVETKGFFGDNNLSRPQELVHGIDRPSKGISSNAFVGLSYRSVDFGISADYLSREFYINPFSIRLSL